MGHRLVRTSMVPPTTWAPDAVAEVAAVATVPVHPAAAAVAVRRTFCSADSESLGHPAAVHCCRPLAAAASYAATVVGASVPGDRVRRPRLPPATARPSTTTDDRDGADCRASGCWDRWSCRCCPDRRCLGLPDLRGLRLEVVAMVSRCDAPTRAEERRTAPKDWCARTPTLSPFRCRRHSTLAYATDHSPTVRPGLPDCWAYASHHRPGSNDY